MYTQLFVKTVTTISMLSNTSPKKIAQILPNDIHTTDLPPQGKSSAENHRKRSKNIFSGTIN